MIGFKPRPSHVPGSTGTFYTRRSGRVKDGAEEAAPSPCSKVMKHASDTSPSKGENVSEAQSEREIARQRFLDCNLQLIRDRLEGVRSNLGEHPEASLLEELESTRIEIEALEEMMGRRESARSDGGGREWRCRWCGNVVVDDDRPTECYHCRRGESDLQLNDERLFQPHR